MYMQGLANFMDDFLGGLMLISYALIVGSVFWGLVILRITNRDRVSDNVARGSIRLLYWGLSPLPPL